MSAEDLRGWARGDAKASERFVTRHYDAIVRFFQTKAGPAAEDLVQTTFLRCGEHAGRWSGAGSPRAFLFGVARNVLLEHYRHKARQPDVDFRESALLDLNAGVATLAGQRESQRALVRGLQMVPVESQILLELFYWEGVSVKEMASMLDVPVGTVKSQLHRARGQLRDVVERLPPALGERESVRMLVADWLEQVQAQRPSSGP